MAQAEREVYEQHFERDRLYAALERIQQHAIRFVPTERPSPLAFPLVIERVRAKVSSETLAQRLAKLRGV
jgi:ATP-dependent Lhr-like helicase